MKARTGMIMIIMTIIMIMIMIMIIMTIKMTVLGVKRRDIISVKVEVYPSQS